MTSTTAPEWFTLSEELLPQIMQRLARSLKDLPLPIEVRSFPMQAHWFLLDSLYLANIANRDGMHANALAITRQCLEAISIIELGLCSFSGSAEMLEKWSLGSQSSGALRKWLESHVWASYGDGLWSEPWKEFMAKLCGAIQPYAHYSSHLAQWQTKIHRMEEESDGGYTGIVEMRPRLCDPQKATRITLYHGLVAFALARIWIAAAKSDKEFESSIDRLRIALGSSIYLDGSRTVWEDQFLAMMWF
jgi:hypothetical protein